MRLLAELKTIEEARSLRDYLEVNSIETNVRDDMPFAVWVLDDDLVEQANSLLDDYNPENDYSAEADLLRQQRESVSKPAHSTHINQHTNASSKTPWTTLALIGISILVAVATKLGDRETEVFRQLLVVPVIERAGQWMVYTNLQWEQPWRLISPMFLHFGVMHLAFNILWLHRFGTQIEHTHGPMALLALACAAQIAGSIAQFQLSGPFFGGMSGVNYALFGFVWIQARYGQRGYHIEKQETVILMGWMVLCATGVVGPIANTVHALGLVSGLLAGLPTYVKFRNVYSDRSKIASGSWADINITGWPRFKRSYIQPYLPLWFIAIAIAIAIVDA